MGGIVTTNDRRLLALGRVNWTRVPRATVIECLTVTANGLRLASPVLQDSLQGLEFLVHWDVDGEEWASVMARLEVLVHQLNSVDGGIYSDVVASLYLACIDVAGGYFAETTMLNLVTAFMNATDSNNPPAITSLLKLMAPYMVDT